VNKSYMILLFCLIAPAIMQGMLNEKPEGARTYGAGAPQACKLKPPFAPVGQMQRWAEQILEERRKEQERGKGKCWYDTLETWVDDIREKQGFTHYWVKNSDGREELHAVTRGGLRNVLACKIPFNSRDPLPDAD
jgi:hypothetical protein